MNTNATNGLLRPIAFFMVGVLLVCTFGFTVDGWQINNNGTTDLPNTDTSTNDKIVTVEKEEAPTEENLPKIPDFVNYLTGLETTEELSKLRPVAVLMSSNTANYGISSADILCEIPTEDDTTRFLAIISDTSGLWKIGSIANGRGYISNISKFFGATIICDKYEDITSYEQCDVSKEMLDISNYPNSYYKEYDLYSFTNSDMLSNALSSTLPDLAQNPKVPCIFNDFGNEPVSGETEAKKISVTYSSLSKTELIYNEQTAAYTLLKNGNQKCDAINGKMMEFTNCFVLFADSVTYDNASGTELVMDTIGSGEGYYFTNGTMLKIKWSSDVDGNLVFTDTNGNPIAVNRGKSYIGYVKSSTIDNVKY